MNDLINRHKRQLVVVADSDREVVVMCVCVCVRGGRIVIKKNFLP